MSGGIVKLQRPAVSFEMLPRTLVQHKTLSQDAKWIPIWLLCKPPGWQIHAPALRRELGWTEMRFSTAVQQLTEEGMWEHTRKRTENGQFLHVWTCFVDPATAPHPRNQGCGEPHPRNPRHGEPRCGEPRRGSRGCIEDIRPEQYQKENNNDEVVVEVNVLVENDVLEKGLLSKKEHQQVLALLEKCENRQEVMDELVAAIRLRGREKTGIRVPASFVRTLIGVDPAELHCSSKELELRQARARQKSRESNPPIINLSVAEQAKKGAPSIVKVLQAKLRMETVQ